MWSGFSWCLVFWEYPVYPNMISKLLWRAAFDFDQYLEPVLPKLWKGFWFWIFCAFVACGSCSIASGALFPVGYSFVSSKTVSVCSRNTHFDKSEGIMLQWRICFIFLKISHILSVLLLYLYCFILELLFSLTAYALCRAPCVIAANQKQKWKVFFLVFSATYALCRAPCAIMANEKQRENLKT